MNLYVYSDESGVFDKTHNNFYVYGGLIILDNENRNNCSRKYRTAEKAIARRYRPGLELKATAIKNSDKGKLFRSMNQYDKFCVVVNQNHVLDSVFSDKKTKQRYLDFAYKMGLKHALECMIHKGVFKAEEIDNIYVFVDEHTTATNGKYELRESLLQEFKYGMHNWNYNLFFPPLFPNLQSVEVTFCNSEKKTLVRAADIIANRIYNNVLSGKDSSNIANLYLRELP